mmetsp:Transcript_68720/g.109033  ORF Transcript_68720/g.109033 Transcript_68720/m.109033 type:complete len:237 (+) Transcript_68720:121-831(+)
MVALLRLVAVLLAASGVTARSDKGYHLRHAEKSAVTLVDTASHESTDAPSAEDVVSSVGSLLQSEAKIMGTTDQKTELRKKVVALLYLEQVLKDNLDSLSAKAVHDKIAKDQGALIKDTTAYTAAMLDNMRWEMHEFSAPLFRKVVREELKDIRSKRKALLDQIMTIDSGDAEANGQTSTPFKLGISKIDSSDRPAGTHSSFWSVGLLASVGVIVLIVASLTASRFRGQSGDLDGQ